MKKEILCIQCPLGCRIVAADKDENGNSITVTGNTCANGEAYAISEMHGSQNAR